MTLSLLLQLVAPFILLALCLWVIVTSRARFRQALQSDFIRQHFTTPTGSIDGSQLRIVHRRTTVSRGSSNEPAEIFWYCVGPGPCYFLALGKVSRQTRKVQVQWILRPLTEAGLRAALVGDRDALKRAFG